MPVKTSTGFLCKPTHQQSWQHHWLTCVDTPEKLPYLDCYSIWLDTLWHCLCVSHELLSDGLVNMSMLRVVSWHQHLWFPTADKKTGLWRHVNMRIYQHGYVGFFVKLEKCEIWWIGSKSKLYEFDPNVKFSWSNPIVILNCLKC